MTLDCESPESAEQSIAECLGISAHELVSSVKDLGEWNPEVNTDMTTDRRLPMVQRVTGGEAEDLEKGKTCWFHATRALDPASFRLGIFPLPRSRELTWDLLRSLVMDRITDTDWKKFRLATEKDSYGLQRDVLREWMNCKGPYAFLFAECALNPENSSSHDYLGFPELVDFIDRCFKRRFGFSLLPRYRSATQPMLIKFTTRGIRAHHLGAALDYLVYRAAGYSLSGICICFSNVGKPVLPSQLVKAIPVESSTTRMGPSVYRAVELSRNVCLTPA